MERKPTKKKVLARKVKKKRRINKVMARTRMILEIHIRNNDN